MAVTFTREQSMAIELHGRNILVSAAAGSGKTAVLVERIVRMVCDEAHPVDIDRLLVVTFTNAAAAEMRERIAAGISKRLSGNPESAHIQRQATLLHNAQITTIDSFCLFLLRNHFNEIGLDPAFRIADEGEVRLMQQEVLGELMEASYASGDEAFRYCVEYFCTGGRESVLEQHILNLSRYAASFPWPARWLEERKEDYGAGTVEEMCASPYAVWLLAHLRRLLAGCAEKLERVRALCQSPDGPYMYGELVDGELEQVERLLACESLEEYAVKLPAVSFGRLPAKKDDSVSPVKRELAKGMRAAVKDSIKDMEERYFATPLELAARQGSACTGPVGSLIDLVLEFDRRMQEKKREKKVIDFSDMEHFALGILLDGEGSEARPSAVALEYRQHFAEILTDEYQDSNLVQEYLLRAVSGEEDGRFNRFMVGDVKQSIYKFRLARPELFLEKYNSYPGCPVREGCVRIDLAKNFRSRLQVVDAVNDVFGRLMSETVGGIPYDERAALYPGAVYPESGDCASELLLVEKPGKEDELGEKQAESLTIARKIKELRGRFQVTDKETGGQRPARYSDMVILLRTNSGWDEEFKETLEREGIPVYITSKTGYFAAAEVQELLQLLRVLDNPSQDIPLFGVMKSLFGGFSEEEAAIIRSGAKACSLYEALKRFARGYREKSSGESGPRETEGLESAEPDALGAKAAAFLHRIREYRECTVYLPIRDLLTKLIGDFGYLDYVTALPAGSRRRANVEMLLTKASDFERTSYFGLFHFIRYMEQLEEYDVDYGGAELLDENADVVRIMSIHKSKGLEFPVTFVAGLSKRFNMQDVNQSLILDMDLGLATDYVDPGRRIRNKTLRRTALSRKLREESLAEELRLLYVAMTRAREKLIMTGVAEHAAQLWEQMREAGHGRLTYLDFVEAGSFLDFLLPVLPGTCVQVTVREQVQEEAEQIREQMGLSRKKAALERAEEFADPEAGKRLSGRLNAVYPYAMLSELYTKTTVSELKIAAMADRDEAAYHTFEEKEVLPYIPLFCRGEEKISGAVRGNAYHRVMELLDFEAVLGRALEETAGPGSGSAAAEHYEAYTQALSPERLAAGLETFLEEETVSGRLSAEYRQAVRGQKIEKFLGSRLAWRMWRAQRQGNLYREQPFVLGIDARRLKGDFPEGETVLIQGIIDVFFQEEDKIVLLDYKTDSVSSMGELWNRYETQLDYYQEAIQKLFGKPVKERILYSFHLGRY
ncbi:MAG: helicase-exonuclease AddAB subunit AddA [Lachnospiraceae bacterium]|nr:helicase-exonuclease AddAB subunit AddA [Lachnospiraceae bacterium]